MSVREVPARQGAPWSPEEDETLRAAFAENAAISDIAGRHQRTTGAIRSRLAKLGLITSDGEPVDPAPAPPSPAPDAAADELARLPLSPRLAAALVELKVHTIEDFAALTPQHLLQVPRMRQRTLRELAWLQAGLKALSEVHAAARRCIASCQRLRAVMQAISPTTDWTDPQQSARHVVQLLSDKVPVVEELTLMCCLAAGWDGAVKDLATRMPEVVAMHMASYPKKSRPAAGSDD